MLLVLFPADPSRWPNLHLHTCGTVSIVILSAHPFHAFQNAQFCYPKCDATSPSHRSISVTVCTLLNAHSTRFTK